MIVLKLSELVGSFEAVKEVMNAKLPMKVAIQLARIGKAITSEVALYEEQRMKLAAELGTPNEAGTHYTFTPENGKLFDAQNKEALAAEIKIDADQIKLADFGSNVELSAQCLIACDKFIDSGV